MAYANTNTTLGPEITHRHEALLDDLGWGILLICAGIFWIIPSGLLPSGTWLLVLGSIIVVFNIARVFAGLGVSWFGITAGAVALLAGIGVFLDVSIPLLPIAVIVIGCCLLLGAREKHQPNAVNGNDENCCK